MKPTLRQKLSYKFERFINKGGTSIFKSLLFFFLGGFVLIVGLRYVLMLIFPDLDYMNNSGDHVWTIFLQMTDPGNMNQDNLSPTWLKITTILAGLLGVIILSMLIAFITSALDKLLYNFRKGRGSVLESEHTIILGWNDRVVDIIRELIIANESEKRAVVVILADANKEEMDDLITKRLPETKTTEIITTSGNPSNINELQRINILGAKSAIVMAKCSDNATENEKIESDVQAIKSIMAIKACQNNESNIPVVSEIFTEEKRSIIDYFDDENLIAIDTWTIMGKLMIQTSLTSGLQLVYNEMLSFDGCEVYFYQADWDDIDFYNLAFHFHDGIPLGIYNKDGLVLRPDKDIRLKKGDQILILAEDDSTINYNRTPQYTPQDLSLISKKLDQKEKSTLILGWHDVGEIFISEANDYLLENSSFDIMYHEPSDIMLQKIDKLQNEFTNLRINVIHKNPMVLEDLKSTNPGNYDSLIILSQQNTSSSSDKVDSDTLIILLLLRGLIQKEDGTNIITQVLNSENQQLINQTNVDDFIISNRLITMVLAQISEEPNIKLLYDDLFSEDGSEIYVKPAFLYFDSFPQKITFADAMGIANKRDEICLGIRKGNQMKDLRNNFGVRLNLPKNEEIILEKDDYLVVLSDDEL
jgi:hypothetical protein